MNRDDIAADLSRREFLRGGSLASLMAALGAVELKAQDKPKEADAPTQYKTTNPPIKCGIIGCGVQGREIANTLARLPNAPVVALCDHYEPFLRRAKESAPDAETFTDYKQLLAKKEVQAVLVATPSHQHREITLAALKAGKHVYCEAPLAHTSDDARAIAAAAKAAVKVNFQSGLQTRSDPQRKFLLEFIRSGAMGRNLKARAQWHKKQSWRKPAPSPEREKEMNWRLRRVDSPGLAGELGIHQMDAGSWFLNARPVSVTGYGGILQWNDGRDVPDTIQCIFEYPEGVTLTFESTLANSFDADYETYFGSDAAIMVRGNKAWLFKEADAPLLGWEVYARKDEFYKETGIALVANATKLAAQGANAAEDPPFTNTPLAHALESFIANSYTHGAGVEDFTSSFGDNEQGLREYLAGLAKNRAPAAGWQEGFEATLIALKANESVLKGQKITFQKEWFEV